MVDLVTAWASYPAFYAHDTVIVYLTLVPDFQKSLTQLTALEDVLSIDTSITDMSSAAQDSDMEAR